MGEFTLLRGKVMRVTKEDACGNRILGPSSVVTSKGFVSVALTSNTTQGDAITVTNANGDDCVSDTPAPKFSNYGVVINFCGVNPEAFTLLTGQPLVYAFDGTTVTGFGVDDDITLDSSGFALEMWSSVPSGACVGGQQAYGYILLPFLQGGVIGDFTVQNDAITFTVTGAQTKGGNAWGAGPYNVVAGSGGAAGPLNTALPTTRHLHLEKTTVAPPTPADGATALGVPATGATAGIPATLTPTNSYAPLNLADFTAHPVTATPSSAWTTGQYIQLRDGSKAHWTGSAWAAGAA
jgi:hypothetical protein